MPRPEQCSDRLDLAIAVIDAMAVSYGAKAAYDLAVKQNDIDVVDRAAALSSARGKEKEAERALADHNEQHCCFGPVR